MPASKPLPPSAPVLIGMALLCLMSACAAPQAAGDAPVVRPVPQTEAVPPAIPVAAAVPQPVRTPTASAVDIPAANAAPSETRTRHATFKRATFNELPGWEQDDLVAGWPAFRSSCAALQRRDAWREVCVQAAGVARNPAAIRAFFESRFALMRILNTDASRDGDITGYFEPLLEGRRQPEGDFNIPVIGVPRDLYTLDWITVPATQRRGIVQVRPQAGALVVLAAAEPGSVALDLRRFVLDTKDRRLRVRLVRAGNTLRADPYPTRGELAALGLPTGIDAPVLAWVNDALALYAMQIQGSGRIRLADSTVLRVQYAEQNGHPFKPLRVAAKSSDKVVTRGAGDGPAEPDRFELEGAGSPDDGAEASGRADAEPDTVVTRGATNKRSAAPARVGQDPATNALVDELLAGKPKSRPSPGSAAGPAPLAAASATATNKPSATAPPTPPPPSALRPAVNGAFGRPVFEPSLLASDPSYVFFKVAVDQAPAEGPPGALGVPLTPGRSVAVDPRVTPLGYPVFLAVPAPQGSPIDMRRLVFAQDTGGAIRGAVRADFFWGFGADAGRLARGTRHRGQMWLLLPKTEAARLGSGGVLTRGAPTPARADGECLIADEVFCQEPD